MSEIELSAFDLEAEKLRLRPLQEGDEALLHGLYPDPGTMRFIGPPLSAEQSAPRFLNIVTRQRKLTLKGRLLVILDKATAASRGHLWYIAVRCRYASTGVGMGLKPGARAQRGWGNAFTALVKRIFVVSLVNEVWARVPAENLTAKQLVVNIEFASCADAVREDWVAKNISLFNSSIIVVCN